MGFVRMPGIEGKVYVPETAPPQQTRKHDCGDCYTCQMCGDERCSVCRGGRPCSRENPSEPKSESPAPVSTPSSPKRVRGR